MTKNLDSEGLKSIAENYDLFYIDLWGVIHNGVKLHDKAIIVLKKLLELNKKFVLLTNAPRPIYAVKIILEKMGMDENLRNHVFTSGEASLSYLGKEHKSQKFYHIGPPRDFDLFRDFKNYKSSKIDDCEYLLCTGLFDEHDKDLNFYKKLKIDSMNFQNVGNTKDSNHYKDVLAMIATNIVIKLNNESITSGLKQKFENKIKKLMKKDNIQNKIESLLGKPVETDKILKKLDKFFK